MRLILATLACLVGVQWSLADTAKVTLEDGTIIQIDGLPKLPKGAKIVAKIISRPEGVAVIRVGGDAAPGREVDHKQLVTKYLEETTNDPEKLSIVSISEPVDLNRVSTFRQGLRDSDRDAPPAWEAVQIGGVAVGVKFRAANAVGAVVRADGVVLISGGAVVGMKEAKNVKIHASAADRAAYLDQNDPFLDELEGLIRPSAKPRRR